MKGWYTKQYNLRFSVQLLLAQAINGNLSKYVQMVQSYISDHF